MSQRKLIVMTMAVTTACLFAFGIYSAKSVIWDKRHQEASFPGAGMFYSSPAQVTEKYPLNIYPAPWLISIIWVTVIFSNIAGTIYLLVQSFSENPLCMPSVTYYYWTFVWGLTTLWTYLFDAENHLACVIIVFFVVVFSWRTLKISGICFNHYKERLASDTKSKNAMHHPFRYLVVESLAVLSMWALVAFSISIGYVCAYKNSRSGSEATLTGFLTPEESATMGLIVIFCSFVAWAILDVAYWGEESDCIQTIYPSFSFTMLGLGISNYDADIGLSFNNMLCIIGSVLSLIATFERSEMKQLFLRRQRTMVNGCTKSR